MKRVTIICIILLLTAAACPAFAKALNKVTDAVVKEDNEKIRVYFLLTQPEVLQGKKIDVESNKNLFWVTLPDSTDPNNKHIFYEWESDALAGLGLRRLSKNRVAARVLFHGKFAPKQKSQLKAELEDDKLVMTFYKQVPPAVVAEKEEETAPVVEVPAKPIDLDAIFGKTENPEALAEVANEGAPAQEKAGAAIAPRDISFGMTALKFGSALIVTIGVIFLLAWAARRMKLPQRLGGGRPDMIRVIGTALVGLKKQVAVVDVAGQYFLIGIGQSGLTRLGVIDDPEAVAKLRGDRGKTAEKPALEKSNVAPLSSLVEAEDPEAVKELPGWAESEYEPEPAGPQSFDQFKEMLDKRRELAAVENSDIVDEPASIRSIRQRLDGLKKL